MEFQFALGETGTKDALRLLHAVEGRLNFAVLRVQTGGGNCPPGSDCYCPPGTVCDNGKSGVGPPHAAHHAVEAFLLSAVFVLTLIVGLGIGFGAGYLSGKRAARVDR